MMRLPYAGDTLIRFDTIPQRDKRTDGRTDRAR